MRRVQVGVALAAAGFSVWEWYRWPNVAALAQENPPTTAFIERYRVRERQAGRRGDVAWKWVAYTRISAHLKRAVLVAEDIGFFSHRGFAVEELERAASDAWSARKLPRGASTITQQLAKNLWLSPSRDPWRKVKEGLLTWQLERHLSKRRILELYLNVAEFGPGVYGAEAATRRYFGFAAAELSEHQAAELAAGLSRPSLWHPGAGGPGYRRQVERIERRMAKAQFLRKQI